MIEVKGLVKIYGTIRAVDGVSFTVRRGDILGFLSKTASGKSTTMKMITGFSCAPMPAWPWWTASMSRPTRWP